MTALAPSRIAGFLSLLAALPPIGVWFTLLFVAQPESLSVFNAATQTASYLLYEEQSTRLWFIWLAFVPVASIVIGLCYLSGLARARKTAAALLASSMVLGISSFALLDWLLAFWILLPSYWGFLSVRQTTKRTRTP